MRNLNRVAGCLPVFLLAATAMSQEPPVRSASQVHQKPIKIVLVGDSTVAIGGGWGPGFCAAMANVTCIDDALNGRSSKSFIGEGAWKKALAEHGDYYLIQFGHNDQKPDPARHTDAQGSFKDYLQRDIDDVRAIGGTPVLVTSLTRRTMRNGRIVEDLKEYAQATREVGAKNSVPVIDLNALSTAMLNGMTQDQADQFDAVLHPDATAENTANPQPRLDRTHLNPQGQHVFGRIVAEQLVKVRPELAPDLTSAPPADTHSPAGEHSLN
jgi:lysophospholipase L1-like esterase